MSSIDFNSAKLTTIPTYCFYGCSSLLEIELPETVTRIDDSAFSSNLTSINLDNITYFGEECLANYAIPYFYLKNEVEYYNKAFPMHTILYLEAETAPSDWVFELTLFVDYGCIEDENYIYSTTTDGVILHQVKKVSETLTVPSTINNLNVVELGIGFNSNLNLIGSSFSKEYMTKINKTYLADYVFVSNTVTKIENYSFVGIDSQLVYIPQGVEYVGIASINNRLVFESSTLPKAYCDDGRIVESSCINALLVFEDLDYYFYNTNISKDNIVIDEDKNMILVKDTNGYSLLKYGVSSETIEVPATYNELPIHTLLSGAIYVSKDTTTPVLVKVSGNVQRIRSYGIYINEGAVYLPSTISIINVNGVYFETTSESRIYINSAIKPTDWDSSFTNLSSSYIYYGVDISGYELSGENLYVRNETSIELVSYIGTSTTIYIPRTIENLPVTKINTGYLSSSSGRSIYIPSNVEIIDENGFLNTSSSYFNFYLETESIPEGWSESFYYNSRSNSSYSYRSMYYSRTFNY